MKTNIFGTREYWDAFWAEIFRRVDKTLAKERKDKERKDQKKLRRGVLHG